VRLPRCPAERRPAAPAAAAEAGALCALKSVAYASRRPPGRAAAARQMRC
jgi:hypothetical protein